MDKHPHITLDNLYELFPYRIKGIVGDDMFNDLVDHHAEFFASVYFMDGIVKVVIINPDAVWDFHRGHFCFKDEEFATYMKLKHG